MRWLLEWRAECFAVAGAAMLASLSPAPTRAVQPPDLAPPPPLLIETSGPQRPASQQAGPQLPGEADAERALADAEQELASGDRRIARRLLELMVARYPDSQAAERARHRLQQIYAGNNNAPVMPKALAMPKEQALPRAAAPPNAAAPEAREAPAPKVAGAQGGPEINSAAGWRAHVRPVRTAAEEFRRSVGDRVFFSDGSAELGSRARAILAAQAQWLKLNPTQPIVIEGYADDTGTREHNSAVAQRRAEAVRARLLEEGVVASRMRLLVLGNQAPVALCSDAVCAAQNRQVVTVIGVRSRNEELASPAARVQPPPPGQLSGSLPGPLPGPLPGMSGLGGPVTGRRQ